LPDITALDEGTMVGKPKDRCDFDLRNVGHKKHARPTRLIGYRQKLTAHEKQCAPKICAGA
jgi:hypothetical protein